MCSNLISSPAFDLAATYFWKGGKCKLINILLDLLTSQLLIATSECFIYCDERVRRAAKSREVHTKTPRKRTTAARVPTAFLVLPNFHSCFYNSIETRYMFSIS